MRLPRPRRTSRWGLYAQKLTKRFRHTLDAETTEATGFIVEEAKRMAVQLNDLMRYLDVDSTDQGGIPTDCEAVLQHALETLQDTITSSGATVTHDPLPTVAANAAQLQLVFQHLLDNALKFRAAAPPRVHVWTERDGNGWRFAVRDNGIGIDPQWTGQLFGFFKRLHPRSTYPGTGMGLALCK
jgi:light-regulated signal transduction histidine kinase (bacteriophytochrome)